RLKFFLELPMFKEKYNLDEMPDPSDERTFQSAIIDLSELTDHERIRWLDLHKELIRVRKKEIIPRMAGVAVGSASYEVIGERLISVKWTLSDGAVLCLAANVGEHSAPWPGGLPEGEPIYLTDVRLPDEMSSGSIAPWSVAWYMKPAGAEARGSGGL
ncbi:MAG: DUF3459 domain-containing protein, partial [Nitrospirota bacterium]